MPSIQFLAANKATTRNVRTRPFHNYFGPVFTVGTDEAFFYSQPIGSLWDIGNPNIVGQICSFTRSIANTVERQQSAKKNCSVRTFLEEMAVSIAQPVFNAGRSSPL